jgi:molybdate/tungstate transport system substrate-binding protein
MQGAFARCRTPPVAIRSRDRLRRIHLTSFTTRSAVAGAVLAVAAAAGVVSATGCRPSADQASQTTADSAARGDSTIVVMNAASMTKPLTIALDSFAARTGIHYQIEPGASLEVARRITELGRRPDVVALADPEVFPNLLMPRYTTWYAVFGRNRIVLAYTDTSKFAHQITPSNWVTVIQRAGVQVGRADPNTDPSGYRTLLVFQLAERYYHKTGLAAALLAAAPQRNVRPREADQVALLQSGDLDYIWTYQNLADQSQLKTVTLPPEIDLGTPADSATYVTASARVVGKKLGDTITVRGAPILFAVTVPSIAPHPALGARFAEYLLSADGQRILRANHFDALASPFIVGSGAPPAVQGAGQAASH